MSACSKERVAHFMETSSRYVQQLQVHVCVRTHVMNYTCSFIWGVLYKPGPPLTRQLQYQAKVPIDLKRGLVVRGEGGSILSNKTVLILSNKTVQFIARWECSSTSSTKTTGSLRTFRSMAPYPPSAHVLCAGCP